uniref:L-Fucosyltransferase n=1 Tax=Romanomermis culicivorax TaxID=13658 RepID=A0A915IIR0_ROMCU
MTRYSDDWIYDLLKNPDIRIHRNDTILIGVHVRRGVDLTWNTRNQVHGHVIAPKSYFVRAVSRFRSIFNTQGDNISRTLFLITSDDPFWCRQNLLARRDENDTIGRDAVLLANPANMREVDLAILASCQHTVMSTGTFSWWAAYLAGGQAIYYENWPRPGSSLSKMVQREDYFLSHWIPMV